MNIIPISINFNDTVEAEVQQVLREGRIAKILEALHNGAELPPELYDDMLHLLQYLGDIFSPYLPAINKDPQITLLDASRDIKLSGLLRERGLFRIYRLITERTDEGIPIYMTLANPDSESKTEPFKTQNDFLKWLCKSAHIGRSVVYSHKRLIDRLLNLGYTLENAFETVVSKPSVVRDVLEWIAEWDSEQNISNLLPDTVERITQKYLPEESDRLTELAYLAEDDPDDIETFEELKDGFSTAVIKMLDEVAEHQSATDAKDLVRHDILGKPEVSYRWDQESESLLVDLINKEIDPEGTEYIVSIETTQFMPQRITAVPVAVVNDIIRRLPIKNRHNLDL